MPTPKMYVDWADFKIYLYDQKGLDKAGCYKAGVTYFNDFFKDKDLEPSTASAFKQWLITTTSPQTGKKRSNYTVNNYLKTLKHISHYLHQIGQLENDFVADWRLLPTEQPDIDILEVGEMYKLLKVAYKLSYRKAVCLETFLATGCRSSELFLAQWEQLKGNKIFINRTKTDKSRRVIIIDKLQEKIEKLERYPHGYIFGGSRGPIHRKNFSLFLKECMKKAGITKNIRTKELRHSYATMSAVSGINNFIIMAAMGHSNILTTQNYIHVTEDALAKAAARLPINDIKSNVEEKIREAREFVDSLKLRSCHASLIEEKGELLIRIPL